MHPSLKWCYADYPYEVARVACLTDSCLGLMAESGDSGTFPAIIANYYTTVHNSLTRGKAHFSVYRNTHFFYAETTLQVVHLNLRNMRRDALHISGDNDDSPKLIRGADTPNV